MQPIATVISVDVTEDEGASVERGEGSCSFLMRNSSSGSLCKKHLLNTIKHKLTPALALNFFSSISSWLMSRAG